MKRLSILLLCLVAAVMPIAAQESSYFEQAWAAYEEGRYSDALQLAMAQCNEDCTFGTKFLVARIFYAVGDYNTSGELARMLLKTKGITDGVKAHLLILVATEDMEKGNDKKALKSYDQAIKLDPQSSWARYERGYFYFTRNIYPKAIADMQASAAIDTTYEEPILVQAYIAEAQKEYATSDQFFHKAMALKEYKDARILAEYASSLAVRGDSAAAVDSLLAAFAIDDTNGRTGRVYNSFLQRCPAALQSRLRAKVAAEPWEARWHALLGDCLEEAGEQDSAYVHYQTAFLMEATVDAGVRPAERLAKALAAADDQEGALAIMDEALLGAPNNLIYRRMQQMYVFESGDVRRAIDVITALMDIDEKQKTSLVYIRGRYHEQLGENDAALQDFLAALKEEPDASEIILALGQQWKRLGNEAEANHNFDKLIRSAPKYYDADKQRPIGITKENDGSLGPFTLPRALYGKGRIDDAQQVVGYMNTKIRRAIKQNPAIQLKETMMYNLACANAYVGLFDDALEMLEISIKYGYREIRHVESDSDFDALRTTGSPEQISRYTEIITRAKQENQDKAAHIHSLIDPIRLTPEQRMRR